MDYALIKDGKCINVVVFENEEKAEAFKDMLINTYAIDDMVILVSGFGIDDLYSNGTWTKYIKPEIIAEPNIDDRINALEQAMLNILI